MTREQAAKLMDLQLEASDVTLVADRLKVHPFAFLAAVKAVSVARRGSVDYSNHDIEIAESCIGAFLHAVTTQTGR